MWIGVPYIVRYRLKIRKFDFPVAGKSTARALIVVPAENMQPLDLRWCAGLGVHAGFD